MQVTRFDDYSFARWIMVDLKWKVTELKNRVESVRREQQYQVVCQCAPCAY